MKKFLLFIVFFLAFLFIIPWAIIQTDWGKNLGISWLSSQIEKNGVFFDSPPKVTILHPLEYEVSDLRLSFQDKKLSIKTLHFRVSLLPLLIKTVSCPFFIADTISFSSQKQPTLLFLPKGENFSQKIVSKIFPFSLKISNLELHHLSVFKEKDLSLKGSGFANKNSFFLSLATFPEEKDQLSLIVKGRKRTQLIQAHVQCNIGSIQAFFPKNPFESKLISNFDLTGSFQTVFSLFQGQSNIKTSPIDGKILATFSDISYPPLDKFSFLTKKPIQLYSHFSLDSNLLLNIFLCRIQTPLFSLIGQGTFPDLKTEKAQFSLEIPKLSAFEIPVEGSLSVNGNLSPPQDPKDPSILDLEFKTLPLEIALQKIEALQGKAKIFLREKNLFDGAISFSSLLQNETLFQGSSHFLWDLSLPSQFTLQEGSFHLPKLEGEFSKLELFPHKVLGKVQIHGEVFPLFQALFPLWTVKSQTHLTLDFQEEKSSLQKILFQFDLKEVQIQELFSKKIRGTGSFHWETIPKNVLVSLALEDLQFQDFSLKELFLDVEKAPSSKQYAFSSIAKGFWNHPLEIRTKGFGNLLENQTFSLDIQELKGVLQTITFTNDLPIPCKFSPSLFLVDPLKLSFADNSQLSVTALLSPQNSHIQISGKHLPTELFFQKIPSKGFFSLETDLVEKEQNTEGFLEFKLENILFPSVTQKTPLEGFGFLSAKLKEKKLSIESSFSLRQKESLRFTSALPCNVSLFPFHIHFSSKQPVQGEFSFSGKLEELLDFIDLGNHHLEGTISCNLQLSGSLAEPDLNGSCLINNGLYENYLTGTSLKDLNILFTANHQKLVLNSFSARDDFGGSLSANGLCSLFLEKKFPFQIDTIFSNLRFINSDLMSADVKGLLTFSGDFSSALAKGSLSITKGILHIPEKLPLSIPSLPVTFEGPPPPGILPAQKDVKTQLLFPIQLEIDLKTENPLLVEGRGLKSSWEGTISLGGTYPDMQTEGALKLISGSFSFSGREFILTEGTVSFSKEDMFPTLAISGKLEQKGTTILTHLKGSLQSPELSFESIPPLPASSTLSLLLFGQDIASLSGTQALQLIATAGSVSTGPNLLELLRRNLGVDRLTFISSPTTKVDDPEKMAFQTGKYIIRGMLVSFSQGIGPGSTQITVEADLSHGFIFQATTQQEEEQGKFYLKYIFSY